MRRRRSSPRPLTLFTSQRQRMPSREPCASANPVMLTSAMSDSKERGSLVPQRRRRKLLLLLLFDLPPGRDVFILILDRHGEHMTAGPVGDEVEIVRRGR